MNYVISTYVDHYDGGNVRTAEFASDTECLEDTFGSARLSEINEINGENFFVISIINLDTRKIVMYVEGTESKKGK